LTMLQNVVHSLEDLAYGSSRLASAIRLLDRAETSCYWYWTGQDVWDSQVTQAANFAYTLLEEEMAQLCHLDRTGPTIFPPWLIPANPGGQRWASSGLVDAPRTGVLYTLVADTNKVRAVSVTLRHAGGEQRVQLRDCGPYPTRTGASRTAHLFMVELPQGLGDTRYFVGAVDGLGNESQSSLERVYLP
jgi:hypothetical protein